MQNKNKHDLLMVRRYHCILQTIHSNRKLPINACTVC